MNPETHALAQVNWQLFITLTLPQDLVGAGDRRLGSVCFAWLRYVAECGRVHFNDLKWCQRSELGELTGRPHFHFLLGGFPQSLTRRDRFAVKNKWESLTHAMSRVYKFDTSLRGVGYVLKGGTAYECGKFRNSADMVVLSESVARSLGRLLLAS